MKKFLYSAMCAAIILLSAFGVTGCDMDVQDKRYVTLVGVTAAEVGVREDIDYFIMPEPAASTKVNAIETLKFSGNLQQIYGGESGYPQAVVVAKSNLISEYSFISDFIAELEKGKEWLLSEKVSSNEIVEAVKNHLSEGMTPTFNAKNLSKAVIENCSVDFVYSSDCKSEIIGFMQTLNSVSETPFGTPEESFFKDDKNFGSAIYSGKVNVYAPDGAPALGIANLLSENKSFGGAEFEYNVVDAQTIQSYVANTDENKNADICVLPVNIAVKLLGKGDRYKLLGTLTHGNLFMLSNNGQEITQSNLHMLKGKKVGIVNIAQVPGLTFKSILKNNDIAYTELK